MTSSNRIHRFVGKQQKVTFACVALGSFAHSSRTMQSLQPQHQMTPEVTLRTEWLSNGIDPSEIATQFTLELVGCLVGSTNRMASYDNNFYMFFVDDAVRSNVVSRMIGFK